ncbi:MAG: PTS sugar transporter subunit IIB [Lactobacillus apis]|uniref:PTS sugar transporter subunit IIB n=1 Tax=Lactobacillus TaxID=1578 RepID=UPI000815A092|nr:MULTISPECIES: PTS sugar transporter subunit IIB [Lactobacillus]AWM74223.1 PTS galactitol transporter subunit IIB [Lactobacillus apis]MBC6361521.1 PTS galactitol transporter subunit IIB [Lactobacillus apis]MBH9985921.1 PTS sugar transporter subunit IIB [Lactobacillus sp. M0390]MCT6877451.1 PTS sugar transporter subunit IIB [Lactobacillus apis]SCB91831.1 PTS system, galactitol-specific IIB component [Lactobacillus apis]
MKKILVACGAGVVTSTSAMNKLQEELAKRGISEDKYTLGQSSVAQVESLAPEYDLVITTTQYDNDAIKVPVINGLPLLTNIGIDSVIDEVIDKLDL